MFIIYTCTHIRHLYIQNTCAHMYVYIYICQYVICLLGNAYIYIYACAILRTSIYYGILIYINYIYISTYGSSLRNVMDSNQTYGTFHHQTRQDQSDNPLKQKKKGPSCRELLINHPILISYIFKLTNI